MKKLLKSILFSILLGILPLCLSGCWDKTELNELAIVLGVGVDKAELPDTINMTIQIEKNSGSKSSSTSSGSGGSSGSNYVNITESGNSVNTVLSQFSHMISRKIYIAQNQVVIFGSDLAKEGIRDHMDYFLRNYQSRLTVNVFVAKGKAEDILAADPMLEQIPAAEVPKLVETQDTTSESVKLTVADLMTDLSSSTKSMVAPILEIVNEEDKKHIHISGTAVFKDDRLVGELDKKETRGYLWVAGKVKNGNLTVNVLGEQAVLRIGSVKSKVNPVIHPDGSLTMEVNVKEENILDSQTGPVSLNTQENTKLLESAAAKAIQDEIQNTLNKSFQLGTDIYGFGNMLMDKYPQEWKSYEQNWDELYKQLDVQVTVSAKVRGDGRMSATDYPEGS